MCQIDYGRDAKKDYTNLFCAKRLQIRLGRKAFFEIKIVSQFSTFWGCLLHPRLFYSTYKLFASFNLCHIDYGRDSRKAHANLTLAKFLLMNLGQHANVLQHQIDC